MAYRRSPRRSFSRRRFRRRGLKPPTQTTRWETCNFSFDALQSINPEVNAFLTESVELLKIPEHMGDPADSGTILESIARRIEIGGIVFNYTLPTATALAGTWSGNAAIDGRLYLVTDRLDATNQPIALPNWDLNEAPVSIAPTVEDNQFPTRIHWRDALFGMCFGGSTVNDRNPIQTHPIRTQNLRLKRFLDDEHGLYFQFFTRDVNRGAGSGYTVTYAVSGTIYYRWVFGR